jgi:uncharacterized membrane protein
MLVMTMIIPVTMIIIGIIFTKHYPAEINHICGYRTRMSMKNMDTWKYAHQISARLWLRCGIILLPISALCMLLFLGRDQDTTGYGGMMITMIQLVVMILTIPVTEHALHQRFHEDGTLR